MSDADLVGCHVEQTVSPTQQRLTDVAASIGLSEATFCRVRSDYYEQELAWRRDVLGAESVNQLCKSMIMENTKLKDKTLAECQKEGRIKFVCCVLQYAGPKLHKDKLTDVMIGMEGKAAVGKKQYNMRMVEGQTSNDLSGFEHNAVTPLGLATPMPVLVSQPIARLPAGQLWMGGGEQDLKLRVDAAEFVKAINGLDGFSAKFADVIG